MFSYPNDDNILWCASVTFFLLEKIFEIKITDTEQTPHVHTGRDIKAVLLDKIMIESIPLQPFLRTLVYF